MTRDEIFNAWAPFGGNWSDWAKPLLFAHIPHSWLQEDLTPLPQTAEVAALRHAGPFAIIVDLPGQRSLQVALELATIGYRPVPLFNGLPETIVREFIPSAADLADPNTTINNWPIVRGLITGAQVLLQPTLPLKAPPAFLLDSRRRTGERSSRPGMFDNRWVTCPADFPSAQVLLDRGLNRALVVTDHFGHVEADLLQVLVAWQQAGIQIHKFQLHIGAEPRPITVRKPNFLARAFYHLSVLTLRRNALGGFGGTIPLSSGG